jgi:hypothetical protein
MISVGSVGTMSYLQSKSDSHLVLRQKIQLIQSNAFKNILREQNLLKRSLILDEALVDIQKIRAENPMQLKNDERAISKIVQNLKAMGLHNQAQY